MCVAALQFTIATDPIQSYPPGSGPIYIFTNVYSKKKKKDNNTLWRWVLQKSTFCISKFVLLYSELRVCSQSDYLHLNFCLSVCKGT